MFTKTRIFVLLTALTVVAICLPVLGADDGDAATAPAHLAGFFERNYLLVEVVVLAIAACVVAAGMASNSSTQAIETIHYDFWGFTPRGRSYTHIPVSVEPSSPAAIRNTLFVLGVIYIILRLTCLAGCFSLIFRFIGGMIDILFQ